MTCNCFFFFISEYCYLKKMQIELAIDISSQKSLSIVTNKQMLCVRLNRTTISSDLESKASPLESSTCLTPIIPIIANSFSRRPSNQIGIFHARVKGVSFRIHCGCSNPRSVLDGITLLRRRLCNGAVSNNASCHLVRINICPSVYSFAAIETSPLHVRNYKQTRMALFAGAASAPEPVSGWYSLPLRPGNFPKKLIYKTMFSYKQTYL